MAESRKVKNKEQKTLKIENVDLIYLYCFVCHLTSLVNLQVKMVVYREEATENEYDILELLDIELTKKSGKGLGLSILGKKSGKGVFVSDIVSIVFWRRGRRGRKLCVYSWGGKFRLSFAIKASVYLSSPN